MEGILRDLIMNSIKADLYTPFFIFKRGTDKFTMNIEKVAKDLVGPGQLYAELTRRKILIKTKDVNSNKVYKMNMKAMKSISFLFKNGYVESIILTINGKNGVYEREVRLYE